ncbi:MAG: hypothetical protein PUP91_10560 [Rhizonema sp. PD37]|nr:hypothetical protein [Rhizonema sp. PD37]
MSTSTISHIDSQVTWASQLNKSLYQVEQQVKFMSLQAEVESLLKQLESLKVQRQASTINEIENN